jgi:hypothetical protein
VGLRREAEAGRVGVGGRPREKVARCAGLAQSLPYFGRASTKSEFCDYALTTPSISSIEPSLFRVSVFSALNGDAVPLLQETRDRTGPCR